MPFIAARSNYSAEMKTSIEQCCGLPLGTLVGFFFANKNLDLRCQ